MTVAAPDLSIIIPAYNEESRLPDTLAKIAAYLSISGRTAEVLVVDDGSTDGTVAAVNAMSGHTSRYARNLQRRKSRQRL